MKKGLSLFLLIVLSSCSSHLDTQKHLRIMVEDGIGYHVTSTNPQMVSYHGDCTFEVAIEPGFKYLSNSADAPFENGLLYVNDVRYAETVSLITVPLRSYSFTLHNDDNLGNVEVNVENGDYQAGKEITLTVTSTSGQFISLTRGKSLYEGGENLSYDFTFTFSLLEDTEIFVNYYKNGYPSIHYYGNGGQLENGGDDVLNVHLAEHHKRVNTLQGASLFYKDGYTLTSWNTQPDGKGQSVGLGSRLTLTNNYPIALYAIWDKWSQEQDFTYEEQADGTLALTSYQGQDKSVVIPQMIKQKKITTINSLCFYDLAVEHIVFPLTLTAVAKDAFHNLSSLTSITMFDNLKEIFDQSFVNCGHLTRVYVNALTAPRFCKTGAAWITDKYDAIKIMNSPKMVIYGDSNALYGYDTALLNETFSDFSTYNFGWKFASSPRFLLNLIMDTLHEEDKLVISPANNWLIWGDYHDFSEEDWKIVEGNYDLLEFADITEHRAFFDTYTQTIKIKEKLSDLTYDDYSRGLNEFGDCMENVKGQTADWYDPNTIFSFDASTLDERLDWLNVHIEEMAMQNIQTYLTFATYNINAVSSKYNTPALRAPYVTKYDEMIHCPLVSDLEDYFYPGNYFYDSNIHLTRAGATIRTQQLISDLSSFL